MALEMSSSSLSKIRYCARPFFVDALKSRPLIASKCAQAVVLYPRSKATGTWHEWFFTHVQTNHLIFFTLGRCSCGYAQAPKLHVHKA